MTRILTFIIALAHFSLIASVEFAEVGWSHIEFGAANYGPDGHTQASQNMTVRKALNISNARNYIDTLAEFGTGDYLPEYQFAVLFRTLDMLVFEHGNTLGVFHVNDLFEDYVEYAVDKLKAYAKKNDYHVIIEGVVSDYTQIDPSETLKPYGKRLYGSAHLKNPEVSFFHERMDGNDLICTPESRRKGRNNLQHLANMSETGLYAFLIYHNNFLPDIEIEEYVNKGIFYNPTSKYKPVEYNFPERKNSERLSLESGTLIPDLLGKVYHIKRETDDAEL